MIDEKKLEQELRVLCRKVDKMRYPSKTEFYKAIDEMKSRLITETEEFEIPSFLRRLP